MPRAPRADDLYALRVPTDVRISPDGRWVCYVVKEPGPDKDDYRLSIWLVAADASAPARRLTLGAKSDTTPRWSPDGRTIAFLSDRGAVLDAGGANSQPKTAAALGPGGVSKGRSDSSQVWLLPVDGGEASQLTRLPEGVSDLAWSPDGKRLCVVSASRTAQATGASRKPGDPPERDIRMIDRLRYMLNGEGFNYDKRPNLWIIDVASGSPTRLTSTDASDEQPAWSPDGRRICFTSDRHPDADLTWRTDLYLIDAAGGPITRLTGGRGDRAFYHPTWSPDGRWVAAMGHRFPAGNASRNDVWRFRVGRGATAGAADVGENLSGASDLMVAAGLNSDLFGFADPRMFWDAAGASITFAAPIEGSYELWRVVVDDHRVDRLTEGRHVISRPDAARIGDRLRVAAVRYTATETPDIVALDLPALGVRAPKPVESRRLTTLMGDAWKDVKITAPVERWHEVDGRRIQGWFYEAPRSGGRPAPLVVQIHGGPATLYGWSLIWEWQNLVARGISVYACNPRGSQGYGEAFCYANFADWGDGPMRDIMGGVDALIADGKADPDRLGVTGGSYGGYLTSWMVGHTDRFKAAVSCRSVNDMTSEMLSGDVAGPLFGKYEYGKNPWEDPQLYLRDSPITYATQINTPLMIQHSEMDLRCPITQGEELFTILRSLKRPVRFMRVPDESHELTRSGAPFRRVENIERIGDWFAHYLIQGKKGLPPL